MTADQIRMYLRELEGKGAEGFAIGGSGSGGKIKILLAPDRLTATGRVEVVSPQITAHTQQLSADVSDATPGGECSRCERGGTIGVTTTAAAPGAAKPIHKIRVLPVAGFRVHSPQPCPVRVRRNNRITLTRTKSGSICCSRANRRSRQDWLASGISYLREMSQTATDQQPLEIRGGHLTVDHLDTKTPHVTLRGADPAT